MSAEIQTPCVPFRWAGFLCCLTLLLLPPFGARGADGNPPERMTYQGYLTDANGDALGSPNPRNYDVVFRIWQHESSTSTSDLLWTEQQTVTVDSGYFSVLLGEGSVYLSEARPALSTVFRGTTASDRWLAITVKDIGGSGVDSNILPRLRLMTSPFTFLAAHAVEADRLVNSSSQQVVTIAGSYVGINQSSPSAALDVTGALKVSGNTTTGTLNVTDDLTAGDKVSAARVYGSTVNFSADGSYFAEVKNISGGNNPVINFDGYDWLQYRRVQNAYDFMINSGTKLTVNSSGISVPSPNTISGYGTIPVGGVILWSGSAGSIPDGWALCDGTAVNGHTTPDLRNRFVVGADPNGVPGTDPPYEIGDTGGADSVTLGTSQIPSHRHSVRDYYFAESSSHGASYYTYWSGSKVGSGDTDEDNRYLFYIDNNTGYEGGGNAHENRPPFYALAFIMRVK
ncbi:MAG: hypothetical protein KDM81_01490 [Verrucomicrobiae bacterium]|nr:hypothetical protein [Verrucomicrobiae bacterium]